MGFFDFNTWRKLVGNSVGYPASPSWTFDVSVDASVPALGPYKTFTSSAGPTSYEDAVNITGHGELTYLAAQKPSTTNAVSAQLQITVDGTQLVTNINGTSSTTGSDHGVGLASGWNNDDAASRRGIGGSIRFHKSLQIEVKYSGAPGASETLQAHYWYWKT